MTVPASCRLCLPLSLSRSSSSYVPLLESVVWRRPADTLTCYMLCESPRIAKLVPHRSPLHSSFIRSFTARINKILLLNSDSEAQFRTSARCGNIILQECPERIFFIFFFNILFMNCKRTEKRIKKKTFKKQ